MILKSSDIFDIVSNFYEVDIRRKTRKYEFVVMRSIAVQLCRRFTRETLFDIGANYLPESSTSKHATIIRSMNKFHDEYVYYNDCFNAKNDYALLKDLVASNKNLDKFVIINSLTEENLSMKAKLKGFSLDNDVFMSVIKELRGMTDDELIELRDTRIKPFKRMLKK